MLGTSRIRTFLLGAFIMSFAGQPAAGIPAFPGAEGMGAEITGGRGGAVLIVNSLNDVNDGSCDVSHCSLREAMLTAGPRIVVFSVAGEIVLDNDITLVRDSFSNLTVAGQTAPGGGITIRGDGRLNDSPIWLGGNSSFTDWVENVIIRYIAIRPGPHTTNCSGCRAVTLGRTRKVMIDHVSMSWSTDQINASGRGAPAGQRWDEVTWQWNIFSEGLARPDLAGPWGCHPDYCGTTRAQHPGHGYGVSNLGDQDVTYHHNLIATHQTRMPKFANDGLVDFRNNVMYGLEVGDSGIKNSNQSVADFNIIGNYYKQAPFSTNSKPFAIRPSAPPARFFVEDNVIVDENDGQVGNGNPVDFKSGQSTISSPHSFPGLAVTTTGASQAFTDVLGDTTTDGGLFGAGSNARLDCQGNWVERRDSVDSRVINDVKNGTGQIIDVPEDVGGWATIDPGTPCPDTDRDGMPDAFEDLHGFNRADPGDASEDADGDGYTNVEEFLNGSTASPILSPPIQL